MTSGLAKAHSHDILWHGKEAHMTFSGLAKAHSHDILWHGKGTLT